MILTRLMRAFPQCCFSLGAQTEADPWDVCLLHGPLAAGMGDWLKERNLHAQRRVGHNGYVIRWLRFGPENERATFALVQGAATDLLEHLPNGTRATYLRHQLNVFNLWRKEAHL